MRGVFKLFWLQGRTSLVACVLLAFLLGWLLTAPIAPMSAGILEFVAEQPLVQKMLAVMMGSELDGPLTVKLLIGSTWSHPFVLLLVWTYAMIGCSRFPAQFVEDGSVDWLLSQPISRRSVLLAQTLQVLIGLLLVVTSLTLGLWQGCRGLDVEAPSLLELALVGWNLFLTGLFFAGFSSLVSGLTSQKMWTLGLASLFILWNLLLGFLKPFLALAKTLAPLSLLSYFRPGEVLRTGEIELVSALVLLIGGLVLWVLALRVVTTRDMT